ncbi:hypothetical protein SDC9_170952 [bioreactor metagenome]|uniref:Uncharacterized protein n=1 Tax=bioreactor metagenome TaxID=1076179 RepID=A0A645GBX8_9ZZZZ
MLLEYAPTATPKTISMANNSMAPDARMANGRMAKTVVSEENIVRDKDWLTLVSIIVNKSTSLMILRFSRIRSKMTMTLFSEYPMMVKRAAMVVLDTSNWKMTMKATNANVSWANVMIAAKA